MDVYNQVELGSTYPLYKSTTASPLSILKPNSLDKITLYLFPRVILYTFFSHFCSFYGGLGVGGLGLGSWIGFLGLGFSVDGVWSLWCGAFWVLWGWGSLYNHKRITLGKNWWVWEPWLGYLQVYLYSIHWGETHHWLSTSAQVTTMQDLSIF